MIFLSLFSSISLHPIGYGRRFVFCFFFLSIFFANFYSTSATASIDNETDNLILTMMRERFKECSVLTIAHRLSVLTRTFNCLYHSKLKAN